ncbi:MAG: DUF998 domain-containing protein [Archaeoglobaceae archaeon]|nr:DUF998 domain-containing protein [Archaeoglobaceae archaeon]MDW8128445.1 DUF998 domain-containing protein [Archaeoglobaceae archaeon]
MSIWRIFGVIAPLIAIFGTFTAITIDPEWNFSENSIRELGECCSYSSSIFNYALILSGIFGFSFSTWLYSKVSNAFGRFGISFLITGYIFLTLIGIFPIGTKLHSSLCIGLAISIFLSMSIFAVYLMPLSRVLAFSTALFLVFGSIGSLYSLHVKIVLFAELFGLISFILWHYAVLMRFLSLDLDKNI